MDVSQVCPLARGWKLGVRAACSNPTLSDRVITRRPALPTYDDASTKVGRRRQLIKAAWLGHCLPTMKNVSIKR
jgi:hypothetical protein